MEQNGTYRLIDQWNRIKSQEINLHINVQLIFGKHERVIQQKDIAFSTNGAEIIRHTCTQN